MKIQREPSLEKYVQSLQFIIDGWATVRTAAAISESGYVNFKEEFYAAVKAYLESNPPLDLRDFGFMYVLLKQKKYPEEVIEDIAQYFENGAPLQSLIDAYRPRG
jgi:hypothetical protein